MLVGHDPVSFPSPRAAYGRSSAASASPSPFASRVSRSRPSTPLPPAHPARRRAPRAAAAPPGRAPPPGPPPPPPLALQHPARPRRLPGLLRQPDPVHLAHGVG